MADAPHFEVIRPAFPQKNHFVTKCQNELCIFIAMNAEIIDRFPSFLKMALAERLVSFDGRNVETNFEPVCVFRKLRGTSVEDYDFLSHAERQGLEKLHKWPHKNDLSYYSCSFFTDLAELKSCFNSKKQLTFARGQLNKTHGAISRGVSSHIDCWLYENSKIKENFEVCHEH